MVYTFTVYGEKGAGERGGGVRERKELFLELVERQREITKGNIFILGAISIQVHV